MYADGYNRLVTYLNTEYANSTQNQLNTENDIENRQTDSIFKRSYYETTISILQVFHALFIGQGRVHIEREALFPIMS